MSTCLCFRNYQCLACEAGERRVTKSSSPSRTRSMAGTARKIAECGTRAGYNRHIKQGEPTCAECKAAQNEAVKRYQREKALANG
jgi:hypothetical protein